MPRGLEESTRMSTKDDYPTDLDEVGDPGNVEFNFRRNPAPHGVKIFDGRRRHMNSI